MTSREEMSSGHSKFCRLLVPLPLLPLPPYPYLSPRWPDPTACSLPSFGSQRETEAWVGSSSAITQLQHSPCARARACPFRPWLPRHTASFKMTKGSRDILGEPEHVTRTHRKYAPFGVQRPEGTPGHVKGHQTVMEWLAAGKESQPWASAPRVWLYPNPS